jgi:hypothetical protein
MNSPHNRAFSDQRRLWGLRRALDVDARNNLSVDKWYLPSHPEQKISLRSFLGPLAVRGFRGILGGSGGASREQSAPHRYSGIPVTLPG